MYMLIACLPYRYCYCDSSFANLLIANIDSFSNLDNLVYTILALIPILAKPAKITPAICRAAACKAKQRELAKACTIAGRAAAAKRPKKEGLRRSKRTAGSNAGRYTTNSGLTANKDDNNAYNRAYIPPTNIKEEEGGNSNNNSVNSGTSNGTNKGKGSSVYKRNEGTLRYKARSVIAYYLKVLIAFKPTSAEWRSAVRYILILPSSSKEEADLVGIGKEAL
ncbi:hypothetical protein P8C59_007674 [Phyllachora maydis]|uniref:Uncharacterized protein n=1 Tax=Phyllachora maydis TaxID=1825666 RepID=A0AAD9I8Y5_9PEZI|nr:hypothetical protein P8C59_007674 [Phyllachora maydis]